MYAISIRFTSLPKRVAFVTSPPKSTFKALLQSSPTLLQAITMSSDKQAPLTLRHDETERGHYGKSAPIRYVPEQDPVQGSLSETTVSTNIVKMPGGTKTHVKVWSGHGSNEALLDFAQQVGGLIKRLGYWQAVEEADEAVTSAKQTLADATAALKTAKREESKTRNNSNASNAEKAEALEKKTAASTAVDAAKLELEQAEEDRAKAAEKPFEFYGSNLSQSEQASWEKIVTNLTVDAPHTDIFGKKREEAGGKTKETFYDCVQMHLQSRFVFNAAELQKFYILCGLRKSPRVTVRQFHDRIHVLNDAIEWLPMKYYSPQATEQTTKCEKFSDSDMVANVMRAMPESWQNDLLKNVKGNMPETTRELLPLLELIEKSPPTTAPKGGDNAKGKSNHGGGAAKKRSTDNSDLRVPRKKPRFQYNKCKHCDKYDGKPETHVTEKCRKWNADGTPKNKESSHKDKKAHKAFAQLKSKTEYNEKLLKKLLKKNRSNKKKTSRRTYDSSDSDSDSS